MSQNKYTRRTFNRFLIALPLISLVAGISSCTHIEPKAFTFGEVVSAPLGCVELLQRSEQGDC
jgi:hypothetical protein